MKINTVSNTNFSSKMIGVDKITQLKLSNKKHIGIKPIRNSIQYIKEYGLDIKSRKN